ncbi:hypothetical protein ACIU1J_32365 [Azospirillum doebereinerae]|uniref:hypothetical protein n=1 Tax=Azospirillum doebereinerae TaxID=92933 RepID=UPI001EE5EAE0|nr:hypothetical protein [Azospirillum doebereinerae]MCG5243970.1 hypothetical protein [Azospirillum doebereinerae]
MSFRTRDKLLLGAVAASGGPALTGVHALRVSDLAHKTALDTSETNYHQASTNTTAPEADGGYSSATFKRRLTGSGVVGTAPREDWLLRGSGLARTTVSGVAGTSATYVNSASQPTLTWAAPVGSTVTAGAVITISAGAGAGQRMTLAEWDGATRTAVLPAAFPVAPDATSKFDILRQHVYTPRLSDYETVVAASYARNKADADKSRRKRLAGGAATWVMTFTPGKAVDVAYTLRGVLPGKPDDTPFPASVTYGPEAAVAPKLMAADIYFGGRECGRFNQLTVDLAAEIDQAPDAGEVFGYDVAEIMSHKTGGKFTVETLALDARDPLSDFMTATPRWITAIWGVPGNGFALTGEMTVGASDEEDQKGRTADGINYRFARPEGWFTLAAF